MTDIARLGFSANTSDLKKAKADLDALVPSAGKAEQATSKFNRAAAGVTAGTKGASAGIRSFEAAATGASSSASRLSRAAMSSSSAMGTVQKAAVGAGASIGNLVQVTQRVGTSFAAADAHVEAYRASLAKIPAAAGSASSSLARLGAAANDNINRLQSTPGNIAAQFQDIGVTAAAGMSPMLIALQQGTQLSSAMAGGVGNLLAGFRQVFSVTTILTIGLVGAVAAGLQMVDWISVAQSLLNGLADAMQEVAVAAAYMGAVMAIAFAPQIIVWITRTTALLIGGLLTAIKSVTLAMIAFAAANPFGAIILAIGIVVGAMWALNDTFGGVFTDILKWVKDAANFIIGSLVGAFNAIKATWKMLPAAIGDYAMQAVNFVIRSVEMMVNGSIVRINALTRKLPFGLGDDLQIGQVSFGEVDNPWAGMADATNSVISEEMGKAKGKDYVQAIGDGISEGASWLAGKMRGLADSLGLDPDKDKAKGAGRSGMSDAEKAAKAYLDLVQATEARIAALKVEATALGMSEEAARLYRNEQDLIAQALAKNIPLTEQMKSQLSDLARQLTDAEVSVEIGKMTKAFQEQQRVLTDQAALIGLSGRDLETQRIYQEMFNAALTAGIPITEAYNRTLRERAALLADMTETNREAEFVQNATKAYEENIVSLQREAAELGLSGVALEAYRRETELLVSAKRANIELSPNQIELIRQQAEEEAYLTEKIRRQREELDFRKTTFRSVIGDMISGLQQGKSVWESFGDAVMKVVDRIIGKLADLATDKLFDNLLSLAGNAAGAMSGMGGASDVSGWINGGDFDFGSITGSAKGNAFDGGIQRFAKGESFTNGIVDTPTLFKFAKGSALGEMGEAGPEAIMPLKRGPDGSLGVQVHGGQQQEVRVVVTADDERFNAYADDRADGRVAAAAPSIAKAGARLGQKRSYDRSRRSIGGR